MPVKLDNPIKINEEIDDFKLKAFYVNPDQKQLLVTYSEINGTGSEVREMAHTIVDPEFTRALTRATQVTIATQNLEKGLGAAIYEEIVAYRNTTGTIT